MLVAVQVERRLDRKRLDADVGKKVRNWEGSSLTPKVSGGLCE